MLVDDIRFIRDILISLPASTRLIKRLAFQPKSLTPSVSNCSEINFIIFSKDRASQLHGLIHSMRERLVGDYTVSVIWKASSDLHRDAYEMLISETPREVNFLCETDFGGFSRSLERALDNAGGLYSCMLVDDDYFVSKVDLNLVTGYLARYPRSIFHLRMGSNKVYSYNTEETLRQLPASSFSGGDTLAWKFWRGSHEWRYPLSLDGNVYRTDYLRAFTRGVSFDGPNSLEYYLHRSFFLFCLISLHGVSYKTSVLVNIPLNRVQDKFRNRSGSVDLAELSRSFLNGYALNYRLDKEISSTHIECEIDLIERS